MSGSEDKIVVGVLDLAEAKRLRTALEAQGVALELFSNPETCQTGSCGTKVELRAQASDVAKIQHYIASERARLLEGLEVNAELLSEVYDSEKESARCPACGEQFSTTLSECPGCGLGFGSG